MRDPFGKVSVARKDHCDRLYDYRLLAIALFSSRSRTVDITTDGLLRIREKLLDLSPRNRLLNFRETTQSLRIVDELPRQVFDVLVNEQKPMAFKPIREEEQGGDRRKPDAKGVQLPVETVLDAELPLTPDTSSDKHEDLLLQTNLVPDKLETRCRRIIQNARAAIEETGTNILFLAMGFLEWYQPEEPDKRNLAPLVLLPVQVERGRLGRATKCYQYLVSYTGEDLETNLCLREKLSRDFDIILPELPDEPDVEAYFALVQEIAETKKKWRVAREMLLGMFSFSKLLMYKDLDPDSWPEERRISMHRSIKDLLEGRTPDQSVSSAAESYSEDVLEKAKLPIVLDADSSQHTALVDALNGRDQVIIGPPGTGKSQTITNLIAAAMSQGKSVLFVSEKLAALEVVRRRLEQVGLGAFCLELHSWKTQKRRMLNDLERRLKLRCDSPRDIQAGIAAYGAAKDSLNAYVKLVNSTASATGETIQQILWAAERWRGDQDADGPVFRIADALELSRQDVSARENPLLDISNHLAIAPLTPENPWRGYRPTNLLAGDEEHVKSILSDAASALESVGKSVAELRRHTQADVDLTLDDVLKADEAVLNRLKSIPEPFDEDFAKTSMTPEVSHSLDALEAQIGIYHAGLRNAAEVLREDIPSDKLSVLTDHTEKLRSLNWAGRSLAQLRSIHATCVEARQSLVDLAQAVKPFVQLGFEQPDTFGQFERVVRAASIVADTPKDLATAICRHHVSADAPTVFNASYTVFRRFESDYANLSPMFDFAKCPPNDDLLHIATVIREKQGRFLSFLSPSLRRARKAAASFLKLPVFLQSPTLPDRLTELADLNRRVEAASTDLATTQKLGPLFKGRQTDWQQLSQAIEWAQELRKHLGSDALADAIVSGLSKHSDCFSSAVARAKQALERASKALLQCAVEGVIREVTAFTEEHSISRQVEYFDTRLAVLDDVLEALAAAATAPHYTALDISNAVTARQIAEVLAREVQGNGSFSRLIGKSFRGIATDTAHLRRIARWIADLQSAALPEALKHWLLDAETPSRAALLTPLFADITETASRVRRAIQALGEFGTLSLPDFLGSVAAHVKLPTTSARLTECLNATTELMPWADYCRMADRAGRLGLSEITAALERGQLRPQHLKETFLRSFYESAAKQIIKAHPELTHFTRASHERVRKQYAEFDVKLMKEFQKQIAYDVARRPVPYGVSRGYVKEYTERSLIEHELTKKRKHIPIRQLVRRAARALKALKPCFMMSPLSVALYLEPAGIEFDLVVMDEASQIRPEEALGAVARARQLVVVGDPKQLPPTPFFERVIEGDEEDEESETAADFAESILDICLKTYRPARQLQWHYRSQHESLIAFSNRQFYENDLIVFPSPQGTLAGLGVLLHHVDGAKYSKGINPAEAQAVAEAVAAHVLKYPNVSLGVGTFNAAQRDVILDALDRLWKENSAAQSVVDEMQQSNEPFFVKNLENIQGDERDVIFISTTFGPDSETGIVHQRFGPIGGATGWRRLNVMFTRAKKRVEVFTSMRPSDIKVDERSSKGAIALKAYLEYAQTGKFTEHGAASSRAPDSDFEISVARVVESFGFTAVPQVGVAGFFIDIGVVHPENKGEFILGIECDGASYHSARSARDRDRLRQEILERLNWKLHRIWSTEWFKNREIEVKRLQDRLSDLRKVKPHAPQ